MEGGGGGGVKGSARGYANRECPQSQRRQEKPHSGGREEEPKHQVTTSKCQPPLTRAHRAEQRPPQLPPITTEPERRAPAYRRRPQRQQHTPSGPPSPSHSTMCPTANIGPESPPPPPHPLTVARHREGGTRWGRRGAPRDQRVISPPLRTVHPPPPTKRTR